MMSSGIHEKPPNNILDNNFTTLTSKSSEHLSLYVTRKYVGCHMKQRNARLQKKQKGGLRKYQLKVFVCTQKYVGCHVKPTFNILRIFLPWWKRSTFWKCLNNAREYFVSLLITRSSIVFLLWQQEIPQTHFKIEIWGLQPEWLTLQSLGRREP